MIHTQRFTRHDSEQTDIVVEFEITKITPATRYSPSEGGEVNIVRAYGADGDVTLTAAEEAEFTEYVVTRYIDYGGDPDVQRDRWQDRKWGDA